MKQLIKAPLRCLLVALPLVVQNVHALDYGRVKIVDEYVRYINDNLAQKISILELPQEEELDRVLLRQEILPSVGSSDVNEGYGWCDAHAVGFLPSPLVKREEIVAYLTDLGLEYHWPEVWSSPLVQIPEPDSAKSAAETLDTLNQRRDLFWAIGYNGYLIFPEPEPPELSPFWRYTMFEGDWRKTWMGKVRDLQMPWIQVEDIGWIYVSYFVMEYGYRIIFYDPQTDDYYDVRQQSWPYLYRYSDGNWLYYEKGSRSGGSPGRAYDSTTGEWIDW